MTGRGPATLSPGIPFLLPWLLFFGTFLIGFNATTFNVVLPHIARATSASALESNLAVISYLVVMTALLLPCGQISDQVSSRGLLIAGFGFVTLGGAGLSLVSSPTAVIVLRMAQGVGASIILAAGGAALVRVLGTKRIAGAMGVYLAGFSLGQVAGPIVPGLLLEYVSYEWLFAGFFPAAVLVVVAGLKVLPRSPAQRPLTLDVPGAAFATVSVVSLFALTTVPSGVVGDTPLVLGLTALMLLSGVGVWWAGTRSPRPLVDPNLLRSGPFVRPLIGAAAMMLPRLSLPIVLALYLQAVLGYSPAQVAIAVAPLAIGVTIASLLMGAATRRWRSEPFSVAGSLVVTIGLVLAWVALTVGSLTALAVAMAIVGLGSGAYGAVASGLVLRRAPKDRAGAANGLRAAATTTSFSVGVAVALAILTWGLGPSDRAAFYAAEGLSASAVTALEMSMHIFMGLCVAASCAAAVLVRRPNQ